MDRLGSFLEREVLLAHDLASTSHLNASVVRSALVLIVAESTLAPIKVQEVVGSLAAAEPLGIVMGTGAAELFEHLLRVLSEAPAKPHVMTGICRGSIRESLEVLLSATWPSTERFDEWKVYVVVALGGAAIANEIRREFSSLALDSTADAE